MTKHTRVPVTVLNALIRSRLGHGLSHWLVVLYLSDGYALPLVSLDRLVIVHPLDHSL